MPRRRERSHVWPYLRQHLLSTAPTYSGDIIQPLEGFFQRAQSCGHLLVQSANLYLFNLVRGPQWAQRRFGGQ